MCLLGPSGSGKTTLLRIASGIEKPTGGRVLINDFEVAGPERFVPPEKRNVGLMFQDFALFPHLTIRDNVAFGLKSLPREDAAREAMAALARVGLERYADDYPHILSGGEQQRVALARAILPRPAVMLMDEPFSGLDVQLRERMQEETLQLLRETRATCLIVTHAPAEAIRLGDRIAVMRAGRLVQVGKAEELYRNPADLFVARLFSEINEIPFIVAGRRAQDARSARSSCRISATATRPFCASAGAPFACSRPARGCRGACCTSSSWAIWRCWKSPRRASSARLFTVVREGEEPARGSEVALSVDPESVLVFPAEADANSDPNVMPPRAEMS